MALTGAAMMAVAVGPALQAEEPAGSKEAHGGLVELVVERAAEASQAPRARRW